MSKTVKNEEPWKIGQDYFYGISRKKSYRKAFPHLLAAAMLGELHCQNLVGYCYKRGLGVERNIPLSLFWYQRAAKYNHRVALYCLALFYEKGEGVKKNERKAFSLYKK